MKVAHLVQRKQTKTIHAIKLQVQQNEAIHTSCSEKNTNSTNKLISALFYTHTTAKHGIEDS